MSDMNKVVRLLNVLHPENDYTLSADMVADGLLDSLDIVTLVPMIEAEFGIIVAGVDVNPVNFRNIATLNDFISRCTQARAQA